MAYRVLIADDKAVFRRKILRFSYWEENADKFVITGEAANGMEVLDILNTERIDVILTDIRMPLLDGISLLKEIHDKKLCPVTILLSEYSDFSYARAGIVGGAFDYLLKPVDAEKIEEVFNRAYAFLHTLEDSQHLPEYNDEFAELMPLSENAVIAEVQQTLIDKCEEKITLSEIAENIYMSPKYLGTLFKKETGVSFKEFQTAVKICRAKKLLADRNIRISEVAERLGYQDIDYFSRVFRQETDVSPSVYRRIKNG